MHVSGVLVRRAHPFTELWFGAPGFRGESRRGWVEENKKRFARLQIRSVASETLHNRLRGCQGGCGRRGVPSPATSQPSEAVSQGNGKQPIIIVADRHGHDRSGCNRLPHAPNQNSISGTRTNVLNSLFASIWRYGTGTGTDIYMITDMDMSDRNIMMNEYIYISFRKNQKEYY